MTDRASPTRTATAFAKTVVFLLLTFVLALTVAWFSTAAVCLSSMRLQLRLADFTCGHNAIYPLGLFFVILLPISGFALAGLLGRLWRMRLRGGPSNNRWRGP
jgi:hypothetical protein